MPPIGKVYLVGAGPGDPELLTLKALKILREAHVVLHDDLVPAAIVSLAHPRAKVVSVGKRCGAKGITQNEINVRMVEAALRGLEVVRLKSGDPSIFGRLAEEIEALEQAKIPFEIVPGITAGIAVAASLGVSLTDREKSSRVVIVTNHRAHGGSKEQRTDWKELARGDATLIIYMPGHDFANLRRDLLEGGLTADTPAVIASRASTPEERHQTTTLGDIDKLPRVESPSILLIGRSLEGINRRPAARSGSDQEGVSRILGYAELILSSC